MAEDVSTYDEDKKKQCELNKVSEQINDISELLLGYREGSFIDIMREIKTLKEQSVKFSQNKNVEKLFSLVDELSSLKEDIEAS
jgi:hypothetical protein